MKLYTDLKQSEKLTDILPLKSADMCYPLPCKDEDKPLLEQGGFGCTPCWSLAALINILPADWWDCNKHCFFEIYKQQDDKQDESSILYVVRYFYYKEEDLNNPNSKNLDFSRITRISTIGSNLIDACVRMIIELHEHKLLSIK